MFVQGCRWWELGSSALACSTTIDLELLLQALEGYNGLQQLPVEKTVNDTPPRFLMESIRSPDTPDKLLMDS